MKNKIECWKILEKCKFWSEKLDYCGEVTV